MKKQNLRISSKSDNRKSENRRKNIKNLLFLIRILKIYIYKTKIENFFDGHHGDNYYYDKWVINGPLMGH